MLRDYKVCLPMILQTYQLNLLANPIKYQNDLLAFGEVWSARLLSALLSERVCPSYMLDARDFLLLENEKNCTIDYTASEHNFIDLKQTEQLVVVTGYIARNQQHETCTLGRNGSDYSATIMAALLVHEMLRFGQM